MSHLVLGVTGSVAAIRTPALYAALTGLGHEVRIVATQPSLYFFDPGEFLPPDGEDERLFSDADEWPGSRYFRDDPVLHIAFRNWADMLIVAPLDANTLAKFSVGISDNFLSCVFRAWDFQKPVVLAPAMNTLMWSSPVTKRHLTQLLVDYGDGKHPQEWSLDRVDSVFAQHAPRVVIVPPQSKRLACGDIGQGAMAEVATLAEVVRKWASEE